MTDDLLMIYLRQPDKKKALVEFGTFFRSSCIGSSPYSPQTEGPSYGFERKRVDVESGKLSFFGLTVALCIELSLKGCRLSGNV